MRVAASREGGDGDAEDKFAIEDHFGRYALSLILDRREKQMKSLRSGIDLLRKGENDCAMVEIQARNYFKQKKTARTFCCSCREASDANYFQVWRDQEDHSPSPEYLHDTIDSILSKYKNLNFPEMRDTRSIDSFERVTRALVASQRS